MAVCHSEATGWTDVDDLSRLSDLKQDAHNLLWAEADVSDLTPDDVRTIGEEFDLDELAVEDAVNLRQRPKLEQYGSHLFIVFHQLDEIDGQLEATQIATFVGDRWVLTVHAGASRVLDEAKRRWQRTPPEREHPSALLHTLMDVLVDDYGEIADRLEEEVERIEETVLERPHAPVQRDVYSVKQRLARLRRYVLPGTRVLEWVVDPDSRKPFSDETAGRFRDVYDHLLRITAQVRNIDDLAQAVIDLTLSEQTKTLNEVSKRLAAWAAIFAAGTLIAGIYGMNFKLFPADDGSLTPFVTAVAMMVVSGAILYYVFKKRDYL